MSIVEYEPGATFPGVIGRTAEESSPAWPAPVRAAKGAAERPVHRARRHGLRPARLLRQPDRDAEPRRDRGERAALQQHAHDRAVLAEPLVHRHRAQPPRQRDGVHHRARDRASRATTASMPFENGMLSEMLVEQGYSTFMVGKWHLTPSNQETAAGPYDRWPLGRGFQRYYGFLGGDTSQWHPDLVYDNHQVEPPKTPEEGYHLSEDLVDKAIAFIADTKQVDPGQAVLPAPLLRRDPRARITWPRSGRTGTRASSTTAGTPTARRPSRARRSSASSRPTPSCHATTRTSPTGTR